MSTHRARKRFGQNFLVDQSVLADCVAAIDPKPDQQIVEIGPGLAALTAGLLTRVAHITAIEIDRDIIAQLKKQFSISQLTLYSGDALEFDFAQLGQDLRIVGNLPYNISTPLLFHLKTFAPILFDLHFMLQKEVVERMVAEPGGRDYGRLSVMLQCHFEIHYLFTVPPSAFDPAPQVESAFVRLTPLQIPLIQPQYANVFAAVVGAAFNQRRKTLRNSLQALLSAHDFERLGIDASQRAERLGVAQYVKLAHYVAQKSEKIDG